MGCVGKGVVARIRTAAMAVVWVAFAFVGRAEVVSNCFSVVEYDDCCTHLVCDLEQFEGMEFVLDLTGDGIRYPYRWTFGPHHTRGWSYSAAVMPGDVISYLDFQGKEMCVGLDPAGEMYCAFAWNDPKPVVDTQDFLGWFHLREVGGKLTIVDCAVETQRGHRMVVAPDEPVDWQTWTDPETAITWRYRVYGDVCGIGCGRPGMAGGETSGGSGGISRSEVCVPEKIGGLPVVKIEGYAFLGCDIGQLYVPSAVTNIAAHAFQDGCVWGMSFEGNAPSVGEDAFAGLEQWCTVYPRIDAEGWPKDIVWHGLQLVYREERIERRGEFSRERVDVEGVRWHDDVEVTERIGRIPRRSGEA